MKDRKKLNIFFFFLIFASSFNYCFFKESDIIYRCGSDDFKVMPKADKGIPINESNTSKRKLDSDGFQDFKIYFDPTNLIKDLVVYNLTHYQDIFLNGIQKAIETLQKLLKIKPLQNDHLVTLQSLGGYGVDIWDTEKFGNKSFYILSSGYDLIIFGRLAGLEGSILASASSKDFEYNNGRPYTGIVNINYKKEYSFGKSQEYFQFLIIHEFTHILGFSSFFSIIIFIIFSIKMMHMV